MSARIRENAHRAPAGTGSGRRPQSLLVAITAAALGYLMWRAGWTLGSGSPWFSLPLFALEAWAIGQLVVIVAVLRRGGRADLSAVEPSGIVPGPGDIAVIVDAAGASHEALQRTLVSMDATNTAASFVVILRDDDPVSASAVASAGGRIRVDPSPDRAAAFWGAVTDEARPFALWIEAGDVVAPDALAHLTQPFADADVAVVQGSVGLLNPDSFLHLREGHDEAAFEREVLLPALGRAGAAPWTGSGSMCRVEAIASIGGLPNGPGSCEAAVARLHARRLTTRYESAVVIRRIAPDTIADYLFDRQLQARDRLRWRSLAIGRPNRLARLALADTHLRSIRQLLATWLLVVALFVAPAPVSGSVSLWLVTAAVVHVMCAWVRHRLAAGTMGWGDWVRQGWRTAGADVAGARNRRPCAKQETSAAGLRTLGRLRLTTFTLLLVDVAVLARGATLVDPDFLPRFGSVERFAVLGAALMCIVALVDVMQVVVRRRQRRADHRIAVELSAIVDGEYCEILDLSPAGAGIALSEARDVGSRLSMTIAVPRLDGTAAAVEADGTVRHTRAVVADDTGPARHVVGLEFGELAPEAWSALFTYCAIVHPAGLDRRIDPEPIVGPETLDIHHSRLQKMVGPLSVIAGILAAGTMFFGPGAGTAFASQSLGEAHACVVAPDGSGRSGGLVQMYSDGAWRDIATTDETGCVALSVPREGRVPVRVHLDGRVERIDQNLLADPRVVFALSEVVVEVVSSSGVPVEGARVQWYGGAWREAGVTGVDGAVRFETWDQRVPVQVWVDGRRKRIDQNVGEDPRVVFALSEVVVEVVSSSGVPVEGARVQWYGGVWREAGVTGVDGAVRFETWDQRVPVQVWVDGRRKRIDQNVGEDPRVVFALSEVVVEVVSSSGVPVEGARVQWYGGVWREAGVTGVDGAVRFETWDQRVPVQVWVDGRRKRIDQNVGEDPRVVFALSEVVVEVVSSSGVPVEGARVQWYGGAWREAGVTGVDGAVRFETWDQRVPVQVWVDGRRQRKDQNVARTPRFVFETVVLPDELVDETAEYYGGQWRPFEPGVEFLPGALRLRRIDATVHTVTLAVTEREPEPESTPTPDPPPVPDPTPEPEAGLEPSPEPGGDGDLEEPTAVEEPATNSSPEPTAEPTPTGSDDGPVPLVLDLPEEEPDASTPTPESPTPTTGAQPTSTPGATDGEAREDDRNPPSLDATASRPDDESADSPEGSESAGSEPGATRDDATPQDASRGEGRNDEGTRDDRTGRDDVVVVIRPIPPSEENSATGAVAFDLEVTNQGLRRAEAPVVVDVDLVPSLTPARIDSGVWRCSHDAGTLRCISPEPIEPGARSTITITAQSPVDGTGDTPTDLAMAAESSAVSVTTGDDVGTPAQPNPAAAPDTTSAAPVLVVDPGRPWPTDTLVLVAVMGLVATVAGLWRARIRRRSRVT